MHLRVKRQLAAGVSALVLAFSPVLVSAQSPKRTINASTITTYPPFDFRDPATGKLVGFDIDLLEAMAEKMDAQINWTAAAFETLLAAIQTKRADLVISGMGDIPERRSVVSLLDYFKDPAVLAILRTNAANFPNEEALCGKRVSLSRANKPMLDAIKNWNQEHCLAAGKPAAEELLTYTQVDALLQMKVGRVDASAQSSVQLAYHNAQQGNEYVIIGQPLNGLTYGIGYAKEDLQFGQALKAALTAVIEDGTYLKLLRKWHLPEDLAIKQPTINGEP